MFFFNFFTQFNIDNDATYDDIKNVNYVDFYSSRKILQKSKIIVIDDNSRSSFSKIFKIDESFFTFFFEIIFSKIERKFINFVSKKRFLDIFENSNFFFVSFFFLKTFINKFNNILANFKNKIFSFDRFVDNDILLKKNFDSQIDDLSREFRVNSTFFDIESIQKMIQSINFLDKRKIEEKFEKKI